MRTVYAIRRADDLSVVYLAHDQETLAREFEIDGLDLDAHEVVAVNRDRLAEHVEKTGASGNYIGTSWIWAMRARPWYERMSKIPPPAPVPVKSPSALLFGHWLRSQEETRS